MQSALPGFGPIDCAVDQAEFARGGKPRGTPPDAQHLAHRAGLFQRQRERAADEAGADEGELVDDHRQASRASRKRAFCPARPTDTRRNSGMP